MTILDSSVHLNKRSSDNFNTCTKIHSFCNRVFLQILTAIIFLKICLNIINALIINSMHIVYVCVFSLSLNFVYHFINDLVNVSIDSKYKWYKW